MKLYPLPTDSKVQQGFNRKLVLTYQDFISWLGSGSPWTSGTAQAIVPSGNALGAVTIKTPATMVFGNFAVNVTTAFASSGGAITHLYFSLGDSTSATRYISASTIDLITAGWAAGTFTRAMITAADNLLGKITITGQTVASLNAGVMELYWYEEDLTQLQYLGGA